MRNLILLPTIIGLFLFNSTLFAQNDQFQLTNIPTPSHDFEVKVFFPDEKPTKPNIKTQVIIATHPYVTTYWDLIRQLQKKAQQVGADAIVLSKGQLPKDFDKDYDYFITSNRLQAVGIKYIENINYLDKLYKDQTTYEYDTKKGIYDFVYQKNFDLRGKIVSVMGTGKFANFQNKTNTQHLVREQSSDWVEKLDANNKLVRSYKNGLKRIKYKTKNKLVTSIDVKSTIAYMNMKIEITHNAKNQEKERVIKYYNRIIRERYFYTKDDILWKIEISQKQEKEAEKPYIKYEYGFHSNKDLAIFLKKEAEKYKL